MFSAFALLSFLSALSSPAHADEICYDMQVCEEVCTDLTIDTATLSYARRAPTSYTPPQHCETVCDIEEYCYPDDTTNGGEGADYGTDDIDACYAEQLLVDQIRCIQMLQQ